MNRMWIFVALLLVALSAQAAEHAFLGVVPDKSVDVAGSADQGLRLSEVVAKGPAAKAGLKAGDVLISFNGKVIEDGDDLSFFLKKARPGDKVALEWMRNGARQKGLAVLSPRDKPDVSVKILGKEFGNTLDDGAFLGVGSLAINSDLLVHFGVKAGHGILIDQVIKGSPAAKAGIKVGDVLVNLDGRGVDSPGRLRSLMSSFKGGDNVRLEVVRNRQLLNVEVVLANRDQSMLEPLEQDAFAPLEGSLPPLLALPQVAMDALLQPVTIMVDASLGTLTRLVRLPAFILEN
jgi:S1-C subfamily serine protease